MPTTKMERHKRAIHCGREKENEDVQSDKRMRYKNGDKLICSKN